MLSTSSATWLIPTSLASIAASNQNLKPMVILRDLRSGWAGMHHGSVPRPGSEPDYPRSGERVRVHAPAEGELGLEVGVVGVGEAQVARGEQGDEDLHHARIELVAGHAAQLGDGVGGADGLAVGV